MKLKYREGQRIFQYDMKDKTTVIRIFKDYNEACEVLGVGQSTVSRNCLEQAQSRNFLIRYEPKLPEPAKEDFIRDPLDAIVPTLPIPVARKKIILNPGPEYKIVAYKDYYNPNVTRYLIQLYLKIK